MKLVFKILLTIPMVGFLLALCLTGVRQFITKGFVGAFEPMASYFGLPPLVVAIISLILCLIVSGILSYFIIVRGTMK